MNQQQAFDILKLGRNVYLTGSAGSGKTFLLNKYIKYLRDKGVEVGVTASTGIAATHLQGITIHSWSGLGIREEVSGHDLLSLMKKRYLSRRYEQTKVLIIDEISMLHAYYLDLVDQACRAFKKNPTPFGGLQVVLCGDFFQLPPVSKNNDEAKFAPQSTVWPEMDLRICYLDEQYRHQDEKLIKILNQIRTNKIGPETLANLSARQGKPQSGFSGITKLYTHNIDVDAINHQQLNSLSGKTYQYDLRGFGRQAILQTLINGCLAPEKLLLKKGAIVMFVKNNFEQGYTNGTLGEVVDFEEHGFPVVQTTAKKQIVAAPVSWVIEEDGSVKAEIVQIPLRLAWAITVHKSQGISLEAAEIDLRKSFAPGMGYVALSRVRTLEGICLKGFNETALMVDQEILELDEEFKELSKIAVRELAELSQSEKIKRQEDFLQSAAPKGNEVKKRQKKIPGATYLQTKELVLKKLSIREMANRRGMTKGTIMGHLEKLISRGEKLDLKHLAPPPKRLAEIKKAFEKSGGRSLSPVREILGDDFSYDELRLARLFLDHE